MNNNRLLTIDALRGFALWGILVMNIQGFALPTAAYFNPLAYGDFSGLNKVIWIVTRLFFDVKFLSIFSTLFGASLVLAGGGRTGLKRLIWLIIFGLVHGYFLFIGDILFTYGTVGLLALGAREWPVTRQVRVGMTLLLISCAVPAALAAAYPWLPSWIKESVNQIVSAQNVSRELSVFREGWLAQLPLRAELSFSNQVLGTLFESGWRAGGCMLLGMAGVRSHFFEGKTFSSQWTWLAFLLGLALTALGIVFGLKAQFSPQAWCAAQALHLLGSFGVTLAWVTALIQFTNSKVLPSLTRAVGSLGQLAFSAYVMQSIVGMLVFGGQGLQLYGKSSRTELFIGAGCFWSLQLLLAKIWLRFFQVGPLEALWRGLYKGEFALLRR